MSSLSEKINRLKGKHGGGAQSRSYASQKTNNFPSFRFHKSDQETLEEIPARVDSDLEYSDDDDDDLPLPSFVRRSLNIQESDLLDDKSGSVDYPSSSSLGHRESSSPIKEGILSKFAKLAPVSLTSQSQSHQQHLHQHQHQQFQSESPEHGTTPVKNESNKETSSCPLPEQATLSQTPSGSSWINQVKGRFAKTVEEKVSEYRKPSQTSGIIEFDSDGGVDGDSNASLCSSMPHSFSENQFLQDVRQEGEGTATPSSTPPRQSLETRSQTHSPKERRRFPYTFRGRGSKSQQVEENLTTATPSINGSEDATSITNSLDTYQNTPPRSSLRTRMMGFMTKSPAQASSPVPTGGRSEPAVSVSLSGEDPFCDLGISRLSDDNLSSSPLGSSMKIRPDNLPVTPFGSVIEADVETALEADEALTFDAGDDGANLTPTLVDNDETIKNPPHEEQLYRKWCMYGIAAYVALLAIVQTLPMYTWLKGCVSGMMMFVPIAVFSTVKFMSVLNDESPKQEFVDGAPRKKGKRSAIIVQEEIQSKYTWMNLWPMKKGSYDPLTYDVRKTSTVRVMLHGPWLEIRFPKTNLPFRRVHDEDEPTAVDFHSRVENIDLSTCSIEILPKNLPSKRIWSKKYPIMIRTKTRKPKASLETSLKMVASNESVLDTSFNSTINFNVDDDIYRSESDDYSTNFDEIMFDAKEDLSDNEQKENSFSRQRKLTSCDLRTTSSAKACDTLNSPDDDSSKTYFLFTRTNREKEEWFNRLLIAAKFMEDWEHQNPRDGSVADLSYETQKSMQQKFAIFMENYFQARSKEEAFSKHQEIGSTPQLTKCAKEQMAFVNIFVARLWHDLHDSKVFFDYLRDKLTKKLLKTKIAQYLNDVRVTALDLGPQLPQVHCASLPWQDDMGLWVDLEIDYTGLCQATVETQGLHLPVKDEPDVEAKELLLNRLAAVADSEEEDSAEEDDEGGGLANVDATVLDDECVGLEGLQPHASSGFGRIVENFLRSELMAKVAETEWVKKKITRKPITLQLQLHSIKGTLTVNFPPAPSDRIWYGFRTPPELEISLRPYVGGQPLLLPEGLSSAILRKCEKLLKDEFMKILVYPNLDDIVLPFMDHVIYSLTPSSTILKQNSLTPQTPI